MKVITSLGLVGALALAGCSATTGASHTSQSPSPSEAAGAVAALVHHSFTLDDQLGAAFEATSGIHVTF
jgi:ABC-type glycerol-3-phosphate transport system substrate-binding protein